MCTSFCACVHRYGKVCVTECVCVCLCGLYYAPDLLLLPVPLACSLTQLAHLRLGNVPTHALLELTRLSHLKTLQYSEDQGRWAYDTNAVRMDPVQLHCSLGRALPLTTVVDTAVAGYGGFSL